MARNISVLFFILLLSSCLNFNLPLANTTPVIQPSLPPKIISPTPPYIPTDTPSINSPTPTNTATRTGPASQTSTFSPTTIVTPASGLELDILGCNTSIDITHGMGEVTNAFPIIRNRTGNALTYLCATLSASDEDRLHPDKTACVDLLPSGDQVILKLTVDTGFKQDTSIRVVLATDQGSLASVDRPSCRDIGLPGSVSVKAGVVEPIP